MEAATAQPNVSPIPQTLVPLNVEVRDEFGAVAGERWDSFLSFDIATVAGAESRCLQFVDPYGDTVFNAIQVPVVRQELSAILGRLEPAHRVDVHALIAYIDAQSGWIHRYLVFVGD